MEITLAIGEEWTVAGQEWRQRTTRRPSEISEQEAMLPNLGGSGDAETKTKHQNLQGMEGGSERNQE